jgi:hypothetical protein
VVPRSWRAAGPISLAGDISDENNPANPEHIAIAYRTIDVGRGGFDLTFARHSITAVACRTTESSSS